MKTKYSILLIFVIFIFASCEDIIDIELNNVDPQIVIEGDVIVGKKITVKISQTADYYDPIDFPAISTAIVTVDDGAGNSEILKQTDTLGLYKSKKLIGEEGKKYNLKIEYNGEEFTSESITPDGVEDWLGFFPSMEVVFGEDTIVMPVFLMLFEDSEPDIPNYYRIRFYKLNDPNKGNGIFEIYDDTEKDTAGVVTYVLAPLREYENFDTIVAELWTINKQTYDFYNTLSDIAGSPGGGGPPPTSTPANPSSNITNNAYGYFSSYTVSIDTLIIFQIPFKKD